jgi:hypothetical protein
LATGIWLDRVDRTFFHRIRASEDSGSLHCDVIDLNGCPRRDFLCERDRYDIVIMHYLWSPPPGWMSEDFGGAATSPLHGPAEWRRRLRSSHARYIFMFGADFNAGNLSGFVPGYECFEVPALPALSVFAAPPCRWAPEIASRPITYRNMTAARLRRLSELRLNLGLDLSYTEVGGEHLVQLREMVNLTDLRLVGTAVADEDMRHVAGCHGLERLNLDATRVSNAAVDLLKELNRLECLSLNHTQIDDAGLRNFRKHHGLKWLSLINTAVGDAGLDHLAGLKNLESLCLVGTRVTASGLKRLRAALPGCTIDRGSG